MDTERGRKAVGGKLEVRLRIREPLVDKDVKIEKWKWLVIDLHLTSRKVRIVSLLYETAGGFVLIGSSLKQQSCGRELMAVENMERN